MESAIFGVAQSGVGRLDDDVRALFEECLSKLRRQDSPASWKAIEDRIAALRARMDQIYDEAPCSDSGAIRPTNELKVFQFGRGATVVWRPCDERRKFLLTGFDASHHASTDLRGRVNDPPIRAPLPRVRQDRGSTQPHAAPSGRRV